MLELLAFLRANSLASALISHEHNSYTVSGPMIKEFYERNQARYQQAKIKVIYISFKPTAPVTGNVSSEKSLEDVARALSEGSLSKTQRTETDARKLAEDLVKQIRGGRVIRVITGQTCQREPGNNSQTHDERGITQKRHGARTGKKFLDRMVTEREADHRPGV